MNKIGNLWTGAVAYVALMTGAGLSIAGNVADTYRTRGAATDALDVILAGAAPALVLLTVELFVSPKWSKDAGFQALRWLGCGAIGALAMLVSWVHLHDLLSSRGQMAIVSVSWPFAIDGMAIMATGLILSIRVRATAPADVQADAPVDTPADIPAEDILAADVPASVSEPGLSLADMMPAPMDVAMAVPATEEVPAIEPATRTRRAGKVDEVEAVQLVFEALEAGTLSLGELDAQLAERYSVNVRTIRRLRARRGLVSVPAVPAQA